MPLTSSTPALVTEVVCPRCEAALDADAETCPHCGSSTSVSSDSPRSTRSMIDRPWLIVLTILHVGVLGIPLYWKTRYSLWTRLLLVGISALYTVAAVAGILWGCAQILRMVRGN